MKFSLRISIFLLFLSLPFLSFSQKAFNTWSREDIFGFFERNNISFEGEYNNSGKNQRILIGSSLLPEETVNYNFYLKEGTLFKALITTTRNTDFDLINHEVENLGYDRIEEMKDQLGNTYWKYDVDKVELIVINKRADWPEVYYRP